MATHPSILAWRIPKTQEPGRIQSRGGKESHTTEWLTQSLSLPGSLQGFPGGTEVKNLPVKAGDGGDNRHSIPGSGRSAGEENGTHSSILAWEIPWTEKSGGLQSMGLQRVRHDWVSDHLCVRTYTHTGSLQDKNVRVDLLISVTFSLVPRTAAVL